jgi:hypothetical protein
LVTFPSEIHSWLVLAIETSFFQTHLNMHKGVIRLLGIHSNAVNIAMRQN